jgi:hypothetical protein
LAARQAHGLSRELGIAAGASAYTLLRVLKATPVLPAGPPVRVLGVDDWAWQKGQRYGTVLVDRERRRVLDLLPGRRRGGPVARREAQPHAAERRKQDGRSRRRERYEQVVALAAQGLSHVPISRRTGVSRHTILRWLAAGHFPERPDRAPRPTLVTPHTAYLRRRWADGCHDALRLWRELRETRGFNGGLATVAAWVLVHLRGATPRVRHVRSSRVSARSGSTWGPSHVPPRGNAREWAPHSTGHRRAKCPTSAAAHRGPVSEELLRRLAEGDARGRHARPVQSSAH